MNELIYIIVTLASMGLVLAAARLGLNYLIACGVVLGIATAVISGKVISFFGFNVSAATTLFAAIFLVTDITSELHGKKAALRIVATTFAANLFFLLVGFLIVQIPASQPTPVADALNGIFSFLPRLMLAGSLAFLVSQTLDIYVFERIKKATHGKHLWLRNNVSTAASQFVDTVILWHVAFVGIIPELWPIIFANYAVKLVAAAIDTPFAYLGVRLGAKGRLND